MSEPIQSISQGDYILVTQQEVSHDSSLSGNGTVDSPLGVVFTFTDNYLQAAGTRWNTSDQIEFSWASTITTYWGQSLENGWNSNIVPIKIIGINRIANS